MKTCIALVTSAILVLPGCSTRRTVTGHFVFRPPETGQRCRMTWTAGDHWDFVSWALLSDPSAGMTLAMAAGYPWDSLPPAGTRVALPLHADMEEALEARLSAARLVRDATVLYERGEPGVMELLNAAVELDPDWSVPRTNIALLHIQQGQADPARRILAPVAHKYAPALVLAVMDWQEGLTDSALSRISEAMSEPDPPPETLAAAGVIYRVTGESYLAAQVWRRILEDPDAPPEIRVMALEVLLRE